MPWPNTDSATRPSAPTNLSGTSSATGIWSLPKPALQSEEAAIREPARYVLWLALREILVLQKPVMPFVTAEIWQAFAGRPGRQPRHSPWNSIRSRIREASRARKAREMEVIQSVIVAARTIKAELDISPSKKISP